MKLSVIFPTFQRVEALKIALDSLLEQKLLPFETIVVDDSEDDETKKLCSLQKYKKIWIKYIFSWYRSIPKARQIWMDNISDEVWWIVFFDDDVKVMPDYLSEVSKFLDKNPKALWWWWKILNFPLKRNIFQNIWYFLFRNKFISAQFTTIDAQYLSPNKIQTVTDMIWCNMFFRKNVIDLWYKFVDWIKRSGYLEETFFAYQIYIDYPGSLFYIPTAEIYHYEAPSWRILKLQWFEWVLYHRYIFTKMFNIKIRKYCWRCLWFLVLQLVKSSNKRELLLDFFKTIKKIKKNKKLIINNPSIVNEFMNKK